MIKNSNVLNGLNLHENQRKTLELTLEYLTDEVLNNMKSIVPKEIDALLEIDQFHNNIQKINRQINEKKYELAAKTLNSLSRQYESFKNHNFVNMDKLGGIILKIDSKLTDLDENYKSISNSQLESTFVKLSNESKIGIFDNNEISLHYKVGSLDSSNDNNSNSLNN